MGTNYYWIDENKAADDPPLHIGKASVGWCFSLHITEEIRSLEDWRVVWARPGYIKNEYGERLTIEEMLDVITNRSHPQPLGWSPAEFSKNSAIPGPNNLARHAIGWHVVAHGPGTWDLCEGYFS